MCDPLAYLFPYTSILKWLDFLSGSLGFKCGSPFFLIQLPGKHCPQLPLSSPLHPPSTEVTTEQGAWSLLCLTWRCHLTQLSWFPLQSKPAWFCISICELHKIMGFTSIFTQASRVLYQVHFLPPLLFPASPNIGPFFLPNRPHTLSCVCPLLTSRVHK
jgi:hypothetical protein